MLELQGEEEVLEFRSTEVSCGPQPCEQALALHPLEVTFTDVLVNHKQPKESTCYQP